MTRNLSALSLVLVLGACGGGASTACPTGGTTVTFAAVVQRALSTSCTSCDGGARPSEGRSLSTQAAVRARAGAVASVTPRGSMPPGGSARPTAVVAAEDIARDPRSG